jgi:hypothetical protein
MEIRPEFQLSKLEILALEERKKNNLKSTIGSFCCGYEKAQETHCNKEDIIDFLHSEITERRDYTASKMCEVIIEFINNLETKKQ